MEKIVDMIHRMDPEHALNEIGKSLKSLFSVVSEDARGRFLLDMVGESENDKVSSFLMSKLKNEKKI